MLSLLLPPPLLLVLLLLALGLASKVVLVQNNLVSNRVVRNELWFGLNKSKHPTANPSENTKKRRGRLVMG
jgi:hypothetical protein